MTSTTCPGSGVCPAEWGFEARWRLSLDVMTLWAPWRNNTENRKSGKPLHLWHEAPECCTSASSRRPQRIKLLGPDISLLVTQDPHPTWTRFALARPAMLVANNPSANLIAEPALILLHRQGAMGRIENRLVDVRERPMRLL